MYRLKAFEQLSGSDNKGAVSIPNNRTQILADLFHVLINCSIMHNLTDQI